MQFCQILLVSMNFTKSPSVGGSNLYSLHYALFLRKPEWLNSFSFPSEKDKNCKKIITIFCNYSLPSLGRARITPISDKSDHDRGKKEKNSKIEKKMFGLKCLKSAVFFDANLSDRFL